MKSSIFDAATSLSQSPSLTELVKGFQNCVEGFGFGSFAYLNTRYNVNKNQDLPVLATYSDAWLDEYLQQGYLRKDPVIKFSPSALIPFKWHDITQPSNVVMQAAKQYSCGHGLTIPIHGPYGELAIVSASGSESSSEVDRLVQDYLPDVQFLAFYLHQQAKALANEPKDIKIHLSPRENEVLAWTAQGKSSWEIGQILGLAERTINQYIHSCFRKLEVHNKHHCVAKALIKGLITL